MISSLIGALSLTLISALTATPGVAVPQPEAVAVIAGHWEGHITYRGNRQDVTLDITQRGPHYLATLDIPAMGMLAVPLDDFSLQKEDVVFTLPLGRGTVHGHVQADTLTGATSDEEYDEFRVLLVLKRSAKERPPYITQAVVFYNNNVRLAGTLVSPADDIPHPAVVVLHGSNPRTRDFFVYKCLGDVFARHGIAVLLYDGRGAGQSTGDFQAATFRDLATDALAGVKFLQGRQDIQGTHVGLWGISQGGWVAPEAASISSNVAFLIIVSGAAVSPGEQMNFSTANSLRSSNFSNRAIEQAIVLRNTVNSYYQGNTSREEAQAAIDSNRRQEWFALASLPGGGNLPKDFAHSKWYREVNYNPVAALEKIKIPVLILWGESDVIMPIEESIPVWQKAFGRAGNRNITYKGFPGADHILSVASTAGEAWSWRRLAPGYFDTMLDWLANEQVRRATVSGARVGSGPSREDLGNATGPRQ
jgi:pimeloyl-ACP methyl ester carboxylesterase